MSNRGRTPNRRTPRKSAPWKRVFGIGALVVVGCVVWFGFGDRPAPPAVPSLREAIAEPQVFSSACRAVGLPVVDLSLLDEETAAALHRAFTDAINQQKDASVLGRLAMTLHAHELYAAALQVYSLTQNLAPQEVRWPYLASKVCEKVGEPRRSIELLEQTVKLDSQNALAFLHLGELYLEQQRPDESRRAYERFTTLKPDSGLGYVGLGQVARAANDLETARRQFELAIQKPPPDFRAHYELGLVYRDLGDAEKAEAHLTLSRQLPGRVNVPDPLLAEVSALSTTLNADQKRFMAAMDGGRNEEAYRIAARMAKRSPNHGGVQHNLAVIARRVGRPDEAERAVRKALELEPGSAESYALLAELLLERSDFEQAKQWVNRGVSIIPDGTPVWAARAKVYKTLGEADEAIRSARKTTELDPQDPAHWRFLAILLTTQQDFAASVPVLERYVEMAPQDTAAREILIQQKAQIAAASQPTETAP